MSERRRWSGRALSAAVVVAMAAVVWNNIEHASSSAAPAKGNAPDYIHRGAVAFYNATTRPDLVPGQAPHCNDQIVGTINKALNKKTDGQILCDDHNKSGSATYAGGTESYLIFRTSLDKKTPHGYVIYIPAAGGRPGDIIVQNGP